jgi:hypothetical protein
VVSEGSPDEVAEKAHVVIDQRPPFVAFLAALPTQPDDFALDVEAAALTS